MGFEWDADKAEANFAKHGVLFSESTNVFHDDLAITISDESDPNEEWFVSLGMGNKDFFVGGRVHVSQREHPQYLSASCRTTGTERV